MRFLLKEQPYEKRIAAGTLRYERDGEPTGVLEHWRVTHALEGYKFLRVDLDGRKSSGDTFLYRVLLNGDGGLEDIRWRFYNADFHAGGQVLFGDGHITAVREIRDGQYFEEEVEEADGVSFFFPAVMGLWMLCGKAVETAVTLDMHHRETAEFMKLTPFSVQLTQTGETFRISWRDQWCEVVLGEHGWPVRMTRPDGLTAVEQRTVQYE